MFSEAMMPCVSAPLLGGAGCWVISLAKPEWVGDFSGASGTMVDWEEVREKVLARGARCVSLSSRFC